MYNVMSCLFLQDNENAFEALTRITEEIEQYKNPTGTRAAPSRSCKDLAMAHPHFENGRFITIYTPK